MHTEEANYYTAVTVAAVVLGIIIIYFIITMIRHQRRNMQLYKAKINAEISTLENERKRIVSTNKAKLFAVETLFLAST